MSGEMLTGQAAPAPTSEATTTVAAQTNAAATTSQTDGGGEGAESQSGSQRTFTQKELDEIVSKRVAKAEAKAERRVIRTLERLMPQQQQHAQPAPRQEAQSEDGKPARRQGEPDDDYLERLTDWKLEQRELRAAAQKQQERAQTLAKKTDGYYADAEKLGDDFDRDAFDEHLTKPIAESLVESDNAPRLMHYLGANVEEMQRISQLSDTRQKTELGKLEARLEAEAKAAAEKKPLERSKAPQALEPVKGGGAKGAPDPSDVGAWIKYHNEREAARMRGR